MDRIRVPSGSKQKMEQVFENLQNYSENNIIKRFEAISINRGILADTITDSSGITTINDDSFKINFTTGLQLSISSGTAIFDNGQFVKIDSLQYHDVPDVTGHYLIKLKYLNNVGTNPIMVQSAFVYGTLGTDNVHQVPTEYLDTYQIISVKLEKSEYNELILNEEDEIHLGIVYVNSHVFDKTNWSFDNTDDKSYIADSGVYDLRSNYIYKFKPVLFDDNKILFKDRDSLGAGNQIQGSIQIRDWVYCNNAEIWTTLRLHNANTYFDFNLYDASHILGPQLKIKPSEDLPINICNSDGNKFVTINLAKKQVGINGDVHSWATVNVTGTLNVTGDIMSNGYVVLTAANAISDNIENFRITTKKSHKSEIATPELYAEQIKNGGLSQNLIVTFKWNKNEVLGYGGYSKFYMTTSSDFTYTEDCWKNFFLYIFDGSSVHNVKITGNDPTTIIDNKRVTQLFVVNANNTPWDGTGINIDANPKFAIIHSNADAYDIVATPVTSNGTVIVGARTLTSHIVDNTPPLPVKMEGQLDMVAGNYYEVKVRGSKGGFTTDWEFYSPNPYLCEPDMLASGIVNLTYTTESKGFTLTIQDSNNTWGTDKVDAYEFIYTTNELGATFGAAHVKSVISYKPSVSISDVRIGKYYCAARPLIAGRQVSTFTISTTLFWTGKTGQEGLDLIYEDYIDFRTYSGTMTWLDGPNLWEIDNGTLGSCGLALTKLPDLASLSTNILTVGNYNYRIDNIVDNSKMQLRSLNNAPELQDVGETNLAFTIGTSKLARLLYGPVSLKGTCTLSEMHFDCDTVVGPRSVFRVYQTDTEDTYDSLIIPTDAAETTQSSNCDVIIGEVQLGTNKFNLYVDLWDPAVDAQNTGGVSGTLLIYGYYSPDDDNK